jgi:hypothetical protein
VDHPDDPYDAPRRAPHHARPPVRGLSAHGSALVCLGDPRAELATMLILQELGLSVDLAADPESAIRWVRQARYELLVVGGADVPLRTVALRMRHASPEARIVLLADDREPPDGLAPLGIEVLRPPLDVNALMRGLGAAA